jgi:hypothetical protein
MKLTKKQIEKRVRELGPVDNAIELTATEGWLLTEACRRAGANLQLARAYLRYALAWDEWEEALAVAIKMREDHKK